MCDIENKNNCCFHEDDLLCCCPVMHCCGGYSEHNNCCPHNRGCCNQCCGGPCGRCCDCCYMKYYKLLQEYKDEIDQIILNYGDRITNIENLYEDIILDITRLKNRYDQQIINIYETMVTDVTYDVVNKKFVKKINNEYYDIVDITQIKNDLNIEYMDDVISYPTFNDFPAEPLRGDDPGVIYIDQSTGNIYQWADGLYKLLVSPNYNELTNKPKLKTNVSDSLNPESSETITGTIKLHKISKTGKFSDIIIDSPNGFVKNVSVYSDTYSPDANGLVDIPALVKGVKIGNGSARYPNSSGIVTINISDLPSDMDTKNTAGATNDESNKLFIVGSREQSENPRTYTNENCYIQNNYLYSNKKKVLTTADEPDLSPYALKAEMSITPGTGSSSDKTTIQLKNGTSTTVLTEHQDISNKANKSEGVKNISFDASTGILTLTMADNTTKTVNLLWKYDNSVLQPRTSGRNVLTTGTMTAAGFFDSTVS